ncbi:MAG: hypothetical protein RLP44_22065 [Aggregatilineales bacterium]
MQNTKSLNFWTNVLLVMADFTIVFGLLMVFSPDFFRDLMFRIYTDFFYTEGTYATLSSADINFQAVFYGVAGGVMIGWAVSMLFIIHIPFRRGEKWAWLALDASLISWFVLDTYASIRFGMSINALLNVGFLILFAIPLAATYRHFFGETAPIPAHTSQQTA